MNLEAEVAVITVAVILAVAFLADAWANVKIIRALERQEEPEPQAEPTRKWHL